MIEKGSRANFPILIAEDDPDQRRLLEKKLLQVGHEYVSVENGRKALEKFEEKFFPIVLTDWMMPEMDGLELCRAIREKMKKGYVFIVLLTSKDSKDDIVAGLEAGADDYLTKPVDTAELIARIKTGTRILELESSLKRATEKYRRLSITDPLTGCYNRGYLSEHLPLEIKRAMRYEHPLSLIICDIDHFKKVNDTYGHLIGDEVLKKVVQWISQCIRNYVDWVARYGGEEFVIVLPETDAKGARSIAERLRRTISNRTIEAEEKLISITASFGVSGLDPHTSHEKISLESLIEQADNYLYQAKQEGRNRVIAGDL
jgi:diguanylate cyclase (GGDEF)-like protein